MQKERGKYYFKIRKLQFKLRKVLFKRGLDKIKNVLEFDAETNSGIIWIFCLIITKIILLRPRSSNAECRIKTIQKSTQKI